MSIVGTSSQTPRFSPDTLPGVAMWLDAADRDSVVLSGSNVTRWLDKSGSGNHASGGVSPTFSNAGIVFNGTTTYLSTPYTSFPAVETVVIVATATPPSNAHNCMLGAGATGGRSYNVLRYPGGVEVRWDKYAVNSYSPTVVAVNTRFLTTGVFTGSGGTTSVNGGAQAGTDSFSFSGTGGTNIGATFENGHFNGTINEILVYNAVLSTAQRQQVEGYLARKWGISELTGHPFRLAGAGLVPTQIPGCAFWIDAADSTTFTLSGSNVTQWRDKTQGFAGTGVGNPVYTTVDGYSAVTFNGTQYIDFGDVADNGTAPLNIFVVSKHNTTGSGSLIAKSFLGIGQNRWALFREGNTLYTFALGDTGQGVLSPTDTNTSRRVISWTWDRSTQTLYQNGTSIATGAYANTSSMNTTNKLLVGAYNNGSGGTPPADGYYLNGSINEIVCIFGTMTTTQRQQIEGYLANKWGLSTALPAPTTTIPYAGAILPMRPFSPLDIDGLSMWLDAADTTTVTLSGSNVTAWADKSGRGYSLTVPSGGYTSPTYSNGVVTTTGSNALWSTSNFEISGNTPVTLFLVGSVTSATDIGPGATIGLAVGDAGGRQSFGVITYQDSTRTFLFAPTTIEPDSFVILTPNISGQRYLLCGFYTGSAVQGTYNGTLMSSQSATLNLASRPFQIGMRNANTGTSSAGTICECLCYTGALSTTQRQQVEVYLADKWGLRGRLGGVSHPYRFGPAVVLPTQISGCSLWLDAADSTTFTLSGSNITQWRDKSGRGYHAVAVGTPTIQSLCNSTYQGVLCSATSAFGYSNATAMNPGQSLTAFAVAYLSGGGEFQRILGFATEATHDHIGQGGCVPFLRRGTDDRIMIERGTGTAAAAVPITQGLLFQGASVIGPTSAIQYINGQSNCAISYTNATFNYTRYGVGQNGRGLGERWPGVICEIITYDALLTDSQRQQVEGYLAWKWGLQSNLPSPTTSWLQMKRALTPAFTPTQIPGCSLWLDAADATTLTLSGSNVTAWADKSGRGYTLTQSTAGFYPTNISNAVSFQSNQHLNIPMAAINNATTYDMFFVLTPISTTNWIMVKQHNGTNTYNALSMTNYANLSRQTGTSGYLYWHTVNSGTIFNSSNAFSTNTPQLFGLHHDGTTLRIHQTGAVFSITTASAAIPDATSTTNFLLGAWSNDSSPPSGFADSNVTNFQLRELLFYSTGMSASQRQRVEGYLAEKWGLRGSLGGLNHPSRFGPPMILPTQISGCTLWLDAADATTLTLSGSNVTAWRNKSGSASLTLFGTAPTYVSNQVVFNASGRFRGAYALTTQTTMFAVYSTSNTTTNARLISVDGNYYGNVHAPAPYEGTDLFVYDGGAGGYWSTLPPQTGLRMYTIGFNGVNSMIWRNGSAATLTGTRAAGPATGSNISVGGNLDGGDPFNGAISELILFSAALTDSQRQQIEGYLAWKWGLQTNLPTSTHPYKTIKP